MIAHIVHDQNGIIKSVALQSTRARGTLELQSDKEGERVTVVDVKEVFPESADLEPSTADSSERLRRISREIRTGFRLDVERKRLEKLK